MSTASLAQILSAAQDMQTAEICVGMKSLAKTLWAFYYALEQEGFEADQALLLTNQFMTVQFMTARRESDNAKTT